MKRQEIFKYMTSGEMPDIEQVRENCLNQAAGEIAVTQKQKKARQIWKPILKFALPALMIACMFCFQIIGPGFWKATELNSGNWFSIVAYASGDTTFEITKDMKVQLPAGTWYINRDYYNPEPQEGAISHSWTMAFDDAGNPIPGGFVIEGENIKSVKFESINGCFVYDAGPTTTVYLENEDITQSKNFIWGPFKLVESRFIGDYQEYLTDTVTITVTFDNGEIMTQIVEITVDEYTGEMFAQIIE